jgi:hypothetical protein
MFHTMLPPLLGTIGPDDGRFIFVSVELTVLAPRLVAVGSGDGGFIVERVG